MYSIRDKHAASCHIFAGNMSNHNPQEIDIKQCILLTGFKKTEDSHQAILLWFLFYTMLKQWPQQKFCTIYGNIANIHKYKRFTSGNFDLANSYHSVKPTVT